MPSSSFFLFHDLKLKCAGSDEQSTSASEKGEGDQEDTPFTDNIATAHFKNIVDEHVENLTITDKEISDTERLTRDQTKNQLWFDKRKSVLTASNFGKAVKTKVEPSHKVKAKLYGNLPQRLYSMEGKVKIKL